jgi:heavy metal translocating P-type ATPase
LRKAPFVRLADRYAIFFLPVTIVVAGLAWALSGDPVRALAVFVVATPCPLILAAPIAFVSGVSRAAKVGVIVKGGGVIERLGKARTVLLDKTGTLTLGTPKVDSVVVFDGVGPDELVRLAASLDQLSAHPLAEALVHHAVGQGLTLSFPEHVTEEPGRGIAGVVEGRSVAAGSSTWLRARGYQPEDSRHEGDGAAGRATIAVAVDGRAAGAIVMADRVRSDASELVSELQAAGIEQVAMVTGDRAAVGAEIGRTLGIDRVLSELGPDEKVEVVHTLQEQGSGPVIMVGDGVNDAPALALADVGIAMGTIGVTVSAETADAVIVVDRVDRVADAVRIGRRSLSIARQSVLMGMGLSLAAMGFAAAGLIVPIVGALLQEAIDVIVILNALRALRG